jgi:transcriptional regulator with XRE-family HTH domain
LTELELRRRLRGMSTVELGEAIGISNATVTAMENRRHRSFSPATVEKVETYFCRDLNDLQRLIPEQTLDQLLEA